MARTKQDWTKGKFELAKSAKLEAIIKENLRGLGYGG
jgi:hypothetical protein